MARIIFILDKEHLQFFFYNEKEIDEVLILNSAKCTENKVRLIYCPELIASNLFLNINVNLMIETLFACLITVVKLMYREGWSITF